MGGALAARRIDTVICRSVSGLPVSMVVCVLLLSRVCVSVCVFHARTIGLEADLLSWRSLLEGGLSPAGCACTDFVVCVCECSYPGYACALSLRGTELTAMPVCVPI